MRDIHQRHSPFWTPLHLAMDEEEAFNDGDRYADDAGPFNRDRRSIQIRGMETSDTVLHIAADSTSKPRNVETRPIDSADDPEAGEAAASLVQNELANPWKGFDDYYEEAIISAREKRLGVVWMDWDPDYAPYGEIFYSYGDPRRFMWDEAYDPHHPLCGWLLREKRMDVDAARECYDVQWLEPDRGFQSGLSNGGMRPLLDYQGQPMRPTLLDDNKVTLWEMWWKNDRTTKPPKQTQNVLKPDQQYMACAGGCGYRTPPGKGQPELAPQACPTCGGDLHRIDALDVDETSLAYARGRRLTVIAPFCSSPDDDPVRDGSWPIPKARSFPGLFITCHVKPGRPVGASDTTRLWDQQIASDTLRTTAIQRVLEHRNYWELPRTGIVDYRNRRFEFRDDQFNVMYRDNSHEMAPSEVIQHNGTGLDPNFAAVFNITQASLTMYRGVTDLGLTPDSSKDIPVGTIDTMVQQGNIQVAYFNRRKNRALSKFYGVVWDYVRETYTPERMSRLNLDGADILARLNPDDLPNFDFVIEDSAPFTGVEKERSDAAKELVAMAVQQPDTWDLYAELTGAPASIIRKIEKRMAKLKGEADAQGGPKPDPTMVATGVANLKKAGALVTPEQEQAALTGMGLPPAQQTNGLPPQLAGAGNGPGMVPGAMSPNGAGM